MPTLTDPIDQTRRASREIVRELGIVSGHADYGVPLSTRHVLVELNKYGSLTHVELASLLKLDKSTISRIIKGLGQQNLISIDKDQNDQRLRRLSLSNDGAKLLEKIDQLANQQVTNALANLSSEERAQVVNGLSLYASALKRARLQSEYLFRPIQPEDNVAVMRLIQQVLKEYGADRPGFAFADPELKDMYGTYHNENACYFVVERKQDKRILGGAGITPLRGADSSTCELVKMYLSADARGLGLGYHLMNKALARAKEMNYEQCYLETLRSMGKANNLYIKFGFQPLEAPRGDTGHHGCDLWYIKSLV